MFPDDFLDGTERGVLAENHLAFLVGDIALHKSLVDKVGQDELSLVKRILLLSQTGIEIQGLLEHQGVDLVQTRLLDHQHLCPFQQVPHQQQVESFHDQVQASFDQDRHVLLCFHLEPPLVSLPDSRAQLAVLL